MPLIKDYVFEIKSDSQSFEALKTQLGVNYAFHGSQFENWYSILHNGLDVTFGKETSLFGLGIYLSLVPNAAENFLSLSHVWKESRLGHRLGCLVGCEVIKHPSVKYEGAATNDHRREDAPRNYLIVPENSLVQVKHLLVYRGHSKKGHGTSFWLIGFYFFILLTIALFRSPMWRDWINKM